VSWGDTGLVIAPTESPTDGDPSGLAGIRALFRLLVEFPPYLGVLVSGTAFPPPRSFQTLAAAIAVDKHSEAANALATANTTGVYMSFAPLG
jgi:hypothetical protein